MNYISFSLNGTWEMMYNEDKYIKTQSPEKEIFSTGKDDLMVENAVPGYWDVGMMNEFYLLRIQIWLLILTMRQQ